MQKLLIIKAGSSYYRFQGQDYHKCELNKASVFSMDQLDTVKNLRDRLLTDGISTAIITKLTIAEEPYTE